MAKEIKYEAVISDKKGEPDDQKLYDRVKAEAAKKFEVYPSAVANGWVVQEYKRRGGTYSVTKTTKGIQVDNIENLKAELAKAEAWLTDITDSLAKGGPGSGPHKGGGDGGAQPSGEHLTRAHTHDDAAAFHQKQSEMLREAQTNLKAAGFASQAATLRDHIVNNDKAASAHELAAQRNYSAAWGGSKIHAERATDSANHKSDYARVKRDQSQTEFSNSSLYS